MKNIGQLCSVRPFRIGGAFDSSERVVVLPASIIRARALLSQRVTVFLLAWEMESNWLTFPGKCNEKLEFRRVSECAGWQVACGHRSSGSRSENTEIPVSGKKLPRQVALYRNDRKCSHAFRSDYETLRTEQVVFAVSFSVSFLGVVSRCRSRPRVATISHKSLAIS